MDAREWVLTEVRNYCRNSPSAETDGFTWDDKTFLRVAIMRLQQRDDSVWSQWLDRLYASPELIQPVRRLLEQLNFIHYQADSDEWIIGGGPSEVTPLFEEDAKSLLRCLTHRFEDEIVADELPARVRQSRTEIMYVENKGDHLAGPARIGRVTFSKTRKTIYYAGRKLQTLKGQGYKANYVDLENGDRYWISRCRQDGRDTLYGGVVEIDEDVRETYWREIRQREDLVELTSYRSEGKH